MSGFGGLFFYELEFVADAGVTSRLSVADATLLVGETGELFAANGLPYNPADKLNFGGYYYLTTKDGLAYTIDGLSGELESVSDAHANTLTFTDAAIQSSAGPRVTFQRDPQGRITSVTAYTYDANGNTLSKVTSATDQALYGWDFENRLFAADVTDAGGTKHIDYQYDADGIRVSSKVDGDETRYLIDTSQPFQQVIEEYAPGGVLKVLYTHGLDLISQNRLAADGTTTARSFYHVDGLGSTRALSDALGLVTDRYTYDAFGRTIGQVGSTGNVYLFAGEQRDLATGLHYLRARWMSPSVGRFYARDPLSGMLRDPVTLHRFLYAGVNPGNRVDPSGKVDISTATLTIAIVGNQIYVNDVRWTFREGFVGEDLVTFTGKVFKGTKYGGTGVLGELRWGTDTWEAISGPTKKGGAPPGVYRIDTARAIIPLQEATENSFGKYYRAYMDPKTGFGFSIPIRHESSTLFKGLAIHPDGSPPGTWGCIGIREDVVSFWTRFQRLPDKSKFRLKIKY